MANVTLSEPLPPPSSLSHQQVSVRVAVAAVGRGGNRIAPISQRQRLQCGRRLLRPPGAGYARNAGLPCATLGAVQNISCQDKPRPTATAPRGRDADQDEENTLDFPFAEPPAPGQVIEVAPGILWARIPLPFRLNHINVYLIDDGDGWAILDTGIGNDATQGGVGRARRTARWPAAG